MDEVYLLVMQGVKNGKGEFYSVVGLYSSIEKAHEGLMQAKANVPKEDLFYETETTVHEGIEFFLGRVKIDETHLIKPVYRGYVTDQIIGGVVLDD